jgi:hypothetical protein
MKILSTIVAKQATLIRRSTELSLPVHLVILDTSYFGRSVSYERKMLMKFTAGFPTPHVLGANLTEPATAKKNAKALGNYFYFNLNFGQQ